MIEKIKNDISNLKGRTIRFRYNGSRNQIEEFDGIVADCYNFIFVVDTGVINRSFSYSDVLIGVLEVDL